ncbi:ABC transporter ATP-binding protein [Niallia sp. NCCP-28]|uniref:ABC transporter ATP-binding protein n=1 Tax=Niallia sp. NCCP-28 TaxID=2934712 RepID=UPI00207E69DA|nr:ABC transporter ATP-binding protein [Niallia sp. NCCP-28]GKU80667.1 peptide ABC transporter ATP-binding protein [Niallia sp. NCCP-28]
MSVLSIKDLSIHHKMETLVRSVSFEIEEGEWHALIGQSGSGKSLTASAIGQLLSKQFSFSGSISLKGQSLFDLSKKELRNIRGREISYIFQDYTSSFTPFYTIGKHFDEYIKTHLSLNKKERREMATSALEAVNLEGERVYKSYSFQMSGGQLQRAAIALAMLLKPKLLIADEPTTALDSVTSKHILELIQKLRVETKCSVLFITHDLRHARKYADHISVMKEGEIIESNAKKEIIYAPKHPYTAQLLSAIPTISDRVSALENVEVLY